MKIPISTVSSLIVFGLASVAHAQQVDVAEDAESLSLRAAGSGQMSPVVLSATLDSGHGLVLGNGGYDSARSGALFDSIAEVRVWGPIALRAGATYSDDTQRMRPSVGARVQLLRQEAHGVDGSLSSFFKTEGFDETEGEIESTAAIGHRFGRSYLLGNVAYGQDPEGNERDGELRASFLRQQGRFVLGGEGRVRSAIGAQHGTHSAVEPRFDALVGPAAFVTFGTFVAFAEVGPSAVRLPAADTRWGVASLAGLASIF
jgi:hypothetical protein